MKQATTIAISLTVALAALSGACGGDGGPKPLGPGGAVGTDSAIAFIARSADKPSPNLYLVDADSGAVQQLTDTEEFEWWPTWSRDRQQLGFIVWPPQPSGTPTATPGGTSPTPLGASPTPGTSPTPGASPAPQQTWPSAEDIKLRFLVVANADGTDQRPIADSVPLQSYSGGFSWAPDGTEIVSMVVADPTEQPVRSKFRIFTVADGSEVPLAEERFGFLPAWSPDGTHIAFGAYVGPVDESGRGENELFLMNSDGSNLRQITDRPGADLSPTWSPDGTRIAWWGEQPSSDPTQTATNVLFMMDMASGQITELGEGLAPTWSPDGQHILFTLEEKPPSGTIRVQPNTEIYVLDVGTGERRALAPHDAPDLWPVWSPDGQRIAFVSARDAPPGEIYVMNADGSDVRRLTVNEALEGMLAWASQ